jgi:hypothetical protein
MRPSLRLLTVSALAAFLLHSPQLRAEDTSHSKLDLMLNDEVIKSLLDEANPEAAFLVRLNMMRAHIEASAFNLTHAHAEDALNHIKHPRTEIYPEIEASMEAHGMANFGAMLDRLEASFASGDKEAMQQNLEAAEAAIDKAEAAISPELLQDGGILPEAAGLLLRAAVVEYHGAFEFSKLSNMVEYHDGAYFVIEARKMLDRIGADAGKRNPEAFAKLNESFEKLEKAWPKEAPPTELVLPVTKMQALVSIIELQLNRLQ